MDGPDAFLEQLRGVLQFLQCHGFDAAAEAVFSRLERLERSESGAEQGREDAHGESTGYEAGTDASRPGGTGLRSKSAEPVLLSRCALTSTHGTANTRTAAAARQWQAVARCRADQLLHHCCCHCTESADNSRAVSEADEDVAAEGPWMPGGAPAELSSAQSGAQEAGTRGRGDAAAAAQQYHHHTLATSAPLELSAATGMHLLPLCPRVVLGLQQQPIPSTPPHSVPCVCLCAPSICHTPLPPYPHRPPAPHRRPVVHPGAVQ